MSEEQAPSTVTLEEMDKAIAEMKKAKDAYTEASKESTRLQGVYKALEEKVIQMMEDCEKKTYIADGVRVTVKYTMSVLTPKTTEDKKKFFDWLRVHKGDEIADAYLSVNSQALQSLYNELSEEFAAQGEVLEIDGLQEPTARTSLSITKV